MTTTITDLARLGETTAALTPDEMVVLGKLVKQYSATLRRNHLRTFYFDGEHSLRTLGKLGMAMPPQIGKLESVLGWPQKAVEVLDNRLELQGFVAADQTEADPSLEQIAVDNDLYTEASMAHTASMIHGVAFATIFAGDPTQGEPEVIITTRSAEEATALWSQRSRRVVAGMTVNSGLDGLESDQINLFLPDRVVSVWKEGNGLAVQRQEHALDRVPMVMLPYRPKLGKRYGASRITRALMNLTDSAVRTLLRMEGTAEFFSFPQRWATGVAEEDFDDTFKTYLNRLLALGADENGNQPTLGTFSAASPQPHIEQLRAIAMLVAGETSIPVSYLGIIHDNPSSADAIRAAESDLVKVAERAQSVYGAKWSEALRIAQHMRDGRADDSLDRLQAKWRDAATPTKAADAQSTMALVQAGVLPAQSEVTWEQLGYDPVTISRLKAANAQQTMVDRIATLAAGAQTERKVPVGITQGDQPDTGDAAIPDSTQMDTDAVL